MSEVVYDTTESRWFKIVIFLVSGIVVGVSIANIVYFDRIRKGTCGAVTHGEAVAMIWVNAILLVIAALVFLWSLWRLIFSRDTRQKVKHYITSPSLGAQGGYTYVAKPGTAVVATGTTESANVVGVGTEPQLAFASAYS